MSKGRQGPDYVESWKKSLEATTVIQVTTDRM